MKIVVAGIGYVGLSLAALLAREHSVTSVDILPEKVDMVNRRVSPIRDAELEKYLEEEKLDLRATLDAESAYKAADVVIVAVPTNYDVERNIFDTSAVENVIASVRRQSSDALIVIKSTVPVGYTESLCKETGENKLIFSPEFLREGKALHDNLYPSRIIIGMPGDEDDHKRVESYARRFADLLVESSKKPDVPVLFMGSTEAEAVKLFSNTYLAMRVAYFNELDTYAEMKNLDAGQIIRGICLDPRIGDHYNNPSFGYGGYCLPKDTRQLRANFDGVPNEIVRAVVASNHVRKDFIADEIAGLAKSGGDEGVVGIYRLVMKLGSDNFRESAILGIIRRLKSRGVRIVIYEPSFAGDTYEGCEVVRDLQYFKACSKVIVANRIAPEIEDIMERVYTRDLFERD